MVDRKQGQRLAEAGWDGLRRRSVVDELPSGIAKRDNPTRKEDRPKFWPAAWPVVLSIVWPADVI